MSESLEQERKRIEWRRRLMQSEEGCDWLRHLYNIWQGRERFLGPDHSGVPRKLVAGLA